MSDEVKAPKSILEQVLEKMFLKLGECDEFDKQTLEELRNLADTNSFTKGNKLLVLLKEQGDVVEDPRIRD